MTKDYFKPHQYEGHIRQFLLDQCDKEIRLNRFSETFGHDLLPGMYVMPIHVIPKPCTVNFRLITNLSAGYYALNTMIEKANVLNLPLDTIVELGAALIDFRRAHGNTFVMWKSDVLRVPNLLGSRSFNPRFSQLLSMSHSMLSNHGISKNLP
jgi:hypothetical protein